MNRFIAEALNAKHDRQRFHCGNDELDRWLQQRARQDQQRHVAAVYVFTPTDDAKRIAGFYSLSSASISLAELPAVVSKKLPRYPFIPAVLIGRLARDVDFPGIGSDLLVNALSRILRISDELAAAVVLVDAKDGKAIKFYERFGFSAINDSKRRMFLPMQTVASVIAQP